MEKIVLTKVSGNLGDQLFIIASSYGYAKKENAHLKILKTKTSTHNYPVYWETLLKRMKPYLIDKYEDNYQYKKFKVWNEVSPVIYEEIDSNYELIYLNGKMQSYKYFNEYREDIKKLFKPEAFLVDFIKNKYNDLIKEKDRVVVIYLDNKDINYYKKSIDLFIDNKPNPLFLFCIDNNIYNMYNESLYQEYQELKTYIEDNRLYETYKLKDDEFLTFTLLQEFNNFIISNYSFIWWCVWLSDYKNVIVPKNRDNNDLYEDNWIKVD